eukprot:11129741-Alexandrium_andersonii.AAC.1
MGIKAKDTQHWVRALRLVLRRDDVQSGDEADHFRMSAANHLCEMYDVFERAAMVPSPSDSEAARRAVSGFLHAYTAL